MSDGSTKTKSGTSRRQFVEGGGAALAALPVMKAGMVQAQELALPKSSVAISAIDVGGAPAP
jgi:putative spermidine/putrescine transport system substrate-binding protein